MDHMAKRMSNDDLARLLDVVLERYPFLRGKLGNEYGIGLMYDDSQITDFVLTNATLLNIPVLGIHDSFIVDHRRVRILKTWMRAAADRVIGVDLPVKTNSPDAEEVPRSAGYAQRLTDHVADYGPLARLRTLEKSKKEG